MANHEGKPLTRLKGRLGALLLIQEAELLLKKENPRVAQPLRTHTTINLLISIKKFVSYQKKKRKNIVLQDNVSSVEKRDT